jgi:CheY-like chemotaxis protein
MPEMDGIEATRRIRAEVPKQFQPIIIALTANAIHGDADICREAGMDDYISKPVKPEDIHAAILRHFGPKETAAV